MFGPVWWFACSMVLGVFSTLAIDVSLGVAANCTLLMWGLLARFRSPVLCGLVGFFVGVTVVEAQTEGPNLSGTVAIQGKIVGAVSGKEADVTVRRWRRLGGNWQATGGRIRVRFCGQVAPTSGAVSILGEAKPVRAHALPGAPARVWTQRLAKVRTTLSCRQQFPPPLVKTPPDADAHVGVLTALATGDRSGVSPEAWTIFRRTGTAHLLAISGFHIGLVAWFVYVVSRWVWRCCGLWWPAGLWSGAPYLMSIVGAWMYAAGAGLPVSAQRAAIMVTIVALTKAMNWSIRIDVLVALSAIAVVMVEPSSVSTVGFQLSFMAVVGLIRFTPWIFRMLGSPSGPLGWLCGSFSATVGATIGTLPVVGWWFQEVATLSPVANIIALPWVAFVVVPCAFAASYLPAPLCSMAQEFGVWALQTLFMVLSLLDVEPIVLAWSSLVCVLGVALCVLPKGWTVMALLLAQVSCERRCEVLRITMLDVGHGESLLVEWPDRRTWLVDGGPPGREVAQYLRRNGHTHIDTVVLTHGHLDHVGGLWSVMESISVGALWVGSSWDERLIQRARARGVPILVSPNETVSTPIGATNDQSLVLPLHWGKYAVLLTGDIERGGEANVLQRLPGPIDVLKVPHHGSNTSSTQAFLAATRPKLALISAGDKHGLPHPAVLERYRQQQTTVLRSDALGSIVIEFHPDALRIWAYRADVGWRRLSGFDD